MADHKINEFPRPPEASDWAQDALVPKKPPFSANRREQLLAFGLYVLAYLYLGYQWWALPLFTAGFIAAAEYLFREQKRSWESWVWLGCLAVTVLSAPLHRLARAAPVPVRFALSRACQP